MLQQYTPPTVLDHMDRLDIDRICWMCGHCQPQGPGHGNVCKNAQSMFASEIGVQFGMVIAKIEEYTRAGSCPGFVLTEDPELLHDLNCLITEADQDAREYREHMARLLDEFRRSAVARV